MAQRSTGATFAEIMVPVAAGAVILGAVGALIYLATRRSPALSGAPARNVRVNPYTSGAHARRITPRAFTDDDDPGYDLDVEGEDVT